MFIKSAGSLINVNDCKWIRKSEQTSLYIKYNGDGITINFSDNSARNHAYDKIWEAMTQRMDYFDLEGIIENYEQ